MSNRRNPKDQAEPHLQKRFDAYSFATVASAVLVAILAIPPVYWSYMCRSSAKWCEGSLVSPRTDNETRERVAKQIAGAENGTAFLGLQVRSAGFWPFNDRLDVVAKFDGGTETVIDTMPPSVSYEAYATPDRAFVGIASISLHPQASRLTAYFPFAGLTKRVFDIEPGYGEGVVAVRNLTYQSEKKRIIVDVTSPNASVKINASTKFAIASTLFGRPESSYGATIAIELSDTLHVRTAYALENEARYAQSEKAFEECRLKAEASDHNEGDVVICPRIQDSDLTTFAGSIAILHWHNGRLEEAAVDSCSRFPYWVSDPSRKAAYVTCDLTSITPDRSDVWLSVYRPPFKDETYFFKAMSCDGLSLFDIQSNGGRGYKFQLSTNCPKISVNEKTFDVELPGDGSKLSAMYVLEVDEHQIPQALRPL